MKTKNILAIGITTFFTFFLMAVLILSPIPSATHDNCVAIIGQVEKVIEGEGENDFVIFLKDDNSYYYVNRGLERGLDLKTLQEQLVGQSITLHYVKHWSPLDPQNQSRHIARLDFDGEYVYNEIKE